VDELEKAAPGVKAVIVNCEECGQPMTLKFTTLRLAESGKVRVYECVDCERLTFISDPPVAAQGARSAKPASS
jgi:hypothetical protein